MEPGSFLRRMIHPGLIYGLCRMYSSWSSRLEYAVISSVHKLIIPECVFQIVAIQATSPTHGISILQVWSVFSLWGKQHVSAINQSHISEFNAVTLHVCFLLVFLYRTCSSLLLPDDKSIPQVVLKISYIKIWGATCHPDTSRLHILSQYQAEKYRHTA